MVEREVYGGVGRSTKLEVGNSWKKVSRIC